jgi:hypothetical protein
MGHDDWAQLDAVAQAELVRRREVTPRELVDAARFRRRLRSRFGPFRARDPMVYWPCPSIFRTNPRSRFRRG